MERHFVLYLSYMSRSVNCVVLPIVMTCLCIISCDDKDYSETNRKISLIAHLLKLQ